MSGGSSGHHTEGAHSESRVKPYTITASGKKSLQSITQIGFTFAVMILLGCGAYSAYTFALNARQGRSTITQSYIPAQPLLAAPAGCRGPEPTIRMAPGQEYVLPEFCRFDFNVVSGTVTLQGMDGATIDVAKGQIVNFPEEFHPIRMWSTGGGAVQASFFPT